MSPLHKKKETWMPLACLVPPLPVLMKRRSTPKFAFARCLHTLRPHFPWGGDWASGIWWFLAEAGHHQPLMPESPLSLVTEPTQPSPLLHLPPTKGDKSRVPSAPGVSCQTNFRTALLTPAQEFSSESENRVWAIFFLNYFKKQICSPSKTCINL